MPVLAGKLHEKRLHIQAIIPVAPLSNSSAARAGTGSVAAGTVACLLAVVSLHFPEDQIVGTLDWTGSDRPGAAPVLATGLVEVPDNDRIDLHLHRIESIHWSTEIWNGGGFGAPETRSPGGWSSTGGHPPIDLGFLTRLPSEVIGSLTIFGPGVVEESLGAIVHLSPGLTHLCLGIASFDDEALVFVSQLERLIHLYAFGNRFTDAGVQQLASLQKLEELYLGQESLTAAAFEFTVQLPKLRRLGVMDVPMTDEELGSLRNRLPNVEVR